MKFATEEELFGISINVILTYIYIYVILRDNVAYEDFRVLDYL